MGPLRPPPATRGGPLRLAAVIVALTLPLAGCSGPARTNEPAYLALYQVQGSENLTLTVEPNPVKVGYAAIDLFPYAEGVSDTAATNATLAFETPAGAWQAPAPMGHPHPGHFTFYVKNFDAPGAWTVRLDLTRANATAPVVADFPVTVAPA